MRPPQELEDELAELHGKLDDMIQMQGQSLEPPPTQLPPLALYPESFAIPPELRYDKKKKNCASKELKTAHTKSDSNNKEQKAEPANNAACNDNDGKVQEK